MVPDFKKTLRAYALGAIAQVLLVIIARKLAPLALFALLLVLLQSWPVRADVVRATDYSSFWIWGGVKPQSVLSQAQSLYILQGQVIEKKRQNISKALVIAQGMNVARIRESKVWLVYRADTLHWTPEIARTLISRLKRWQLAGNSVIGLQIDFDAKTRHLQEYVEFLRQLRAQLPANYKLSITGLLDWSSNGDIEAINQLKSVVDEVTIQTYQGRKSVANYNAYLPALKRLTVPFKIGLIQDGEWQAPEDLESNPWFQGYIIFLQNQALRQTDS
jgi:hypothetical protein